jgi:hypothetical protein
MHTDWDEERVLTLSRGTLIEAGIGMSEGDLVEIEFIGEETAVAWNMHSHDGTQRPSHSEGRASSGSFEFVAPYDGEFWSFWTNDASDTTTVEVRFRLSGSASFHGWQDGF